MGINTELLLPVGTIHALVLACHCLHLTFQFIHVQRPLCLLLLSKPHGSMSPLISTPFTYLMYLSQPAFSDTATRTCQAGTTCLTHICRRIGNSRGVSWGPDAHPWCYLDVHRPRPSPVPVPTLWDESHLQCCWASDGGSTTCPSRNCLFWWQRVPAASHPCCP